MFHSIYPATGQLLAEHPALDESQLKNKLQLSGIAFDQWRKIAPDERVATIQKLHSAISASGSDLASSVSWEMGKPLSQSEAEVSKCLWLLREFADSSAAFLADAEHGYPDIHVVVRHDPIGVVFGIMPWNFPLWQTMRYAIPALLSGNAVLLKPAPNVLQTSLKLESLIAEVSPVPGLFQVLEIGVDQVESVIAHENVRGVTLTGSDRAGSAVAALAGKYLKKSVLELGGSDPFIVLQDANIELAASEFILSRMNNTGQTCIAAKRALVAHEIADAFTDAVIEKVNMLKMGDPFDGVSDISCLARPDLAENLERQVEAAIGQNGNLILSGGRVDNSCFFSPCVFLEPAKDSALWKEEVFGPVVLITRFTDMDEAVRLANDTKYGLGASIWTSDRERGMLLAAEIDAGNIHINRMVSSDPRVPFGGVKSSGYGRELGREGFLEFTNLKAVTSPGES